jgi:hypothetical protein
MSLPCEWSWARLSTAPVVALYGEPTTRLALMQMLFWRENFEDGHCPFPSPGLFAATYLELPELSLIS